MAIIGPADLPKVLKVRSEPLKLRVLHHLGYPNVNIEISETQFEELLRVTGDFISTYFPQTERYSYFYTQPMKTTYDLPSDAWWIREVAWDPMVSRIQDVFSAEMFLFCISSDNAHILTENGLKHHTELNKEDKLVTPFGLEPYELELHDHAQPLLEIVYDSGFIKCTTNQPMKIDGFDVDDSLEGWITAEDLNVGDKLVTQHGATTIRSIDRIDEDATVTISTPSGCFYACSEGEPIVIH